MSERRGGAPTTARVPLPTDCDTGLVDARGPHLGCPERPDAQARVVLETAGTFPERFVARPCR
ncbi:hypothetical protein [Streptomyces noursei]|uniref:hypothetical protein n=1 Tax=Streptomyces noursei TaxID=1971 RepID=UPI0019637B35|nr:hypothetical protein [Streptomyces noursei]QRX90759.1 hypothetical protein JNO44_07885 [Streptomyces noursei]